MQIEQDSLEVALRRMPESELREHPLTKTCFMQYSSVHHVSLDQIVTRLCHTYRYNVQHPHVRSIIKEYGIIPMDIE